jgi:hypothetical protein
MTTGFQSIKRIVQRAICGVFGHDTLLQFEDYRLSLRCAACGYQTTGWTIGEPPTRPKTAAAPVPRRVEARHAA